MANRVLLEKTLVSECPETSRYIKRTGSSGSVLLALYFGPSFIHVFFSFSFLYLIFFFFCSCLARMRLHQILIVFLSLIRLTVGAASEQDLPQCAVCSFVANWNPHLSLLTSRAAGWLPIANTKSSHNIMRNHRHDMSLCRQALPKHPLQMYQGQLHHERVIE